LHALVPRVDCAEHGVVTVALTWSARRSEFTESFERITIALIREMSVAAVSHRMAVSWDEVDAIMMRAVERGLTRQQPRLVKKSVSTRRQSRRAIATHPRLRSRCGRCAFRRPWPQACDDRCLLGRASARNRISIRRWHLFADGTCSRNATPTIRESHPQIVGWIGRAKGRALDRRRDKSHLGNECALCFT